MSPMLKLNDSSSLMLEEIAEGHQLKWIGDLAGGGAGAFSICWIASKNQYGVPESH